VTEIMVQIGALDRQKTDTTVKGVFKVVQNLGFHLDPVHPGSDDPKLSSWFRVQVENAGQVAKVVDTLRTNPDVKAAYVKPRDEAP